MAGLREDLCFSEDITVQIDLDSTLELVPKPDITDSGQKTRFARDLLLIFVQQNFVGCRQDLAVPTDLQVDYKKALEVDSEQLNINVRSPELLWAAKEILRELAGSGEKTTISLLVWRLRSTVVHQHVLDERTGGLYEEFKDIVAELDTALEQEKDVLISACVHLEIVQGFILFKRITEAGNYLTKVKTLLQTQLQLVSMLGYRTRFQTKPLPQLALKVVSAVDEGLLAKSSETHSATQLPKLLLLEDDTRLEKVRFVNEEFGEIVDLPSVIQCLIITEM